MSNRHNQARGYACLAIAAVAITVALITMLVRPFGVTLITMLVRPFGVALSIPIALTRIVAARRWRSGCCHDGEMVRPHSVAVDEGGHGVAARPRHLPCVGKNRLVPWDGVLFGRDSASWITPAHGDRRVGREMVERYDDVDRPDVGVEHVARIARHRTTVRIHAVAVSGHQIGREAPV